MVKRCLHRVLQSLMLAAFSSPCLVAQRPKLETAFVLPAPAATNGVAILNGRTFMVIAKQQGQHVPQIAEWSHGTLTPYPNAAWNAWQPGMDASQAFVHANSIRFDPGGKLWVVDIGSTAYAKPVEPKGPKLVEIDIATGKVDRVYYFPNTTSRLSFLDDVRFFNSDTAYLTDAGDVPGIIVLNLKTGAARKVLTRAPSVTGVALTGEGHKVQTPEGKDIFVNADQLEISPDGKWLYYMPCSGPLSKVETRYLSDPSLSAAQLQSHVQPFAHNGAAGGTAIDASGNVYVSDNNALSVLKITPDGHVSTLVQDPRLIWVDAMYITPDGYLYMPAAQMDRTPGFHHGVNAVTYPMTVFRTKVVAGPPANDHR